MESLSALRNVTSIYNETPLKLYISDDILLMLTSFDGFARFKILSKIVRGFFYPKNHFFNFFRKITRIKTRLILFYSESSDDLIRHRIHFIFRKNAQKCHFFEKIYFHFD